jgi:hypothetical protein
MSIYKNSRYCGVFRQKKHTNGVAIISEWIFQGVIVASVSVSLTWASEIDHQTQPPNSNASLSEQQNTVIFSAKSKPARTQPFKQANFELEIASQSTRQVADWIVDSGDNQRMPFVIIDKTNAKVFVFNVNGQLRGAAPALLGLSVGDDATPGIGNQKLATIRPEERTTPAGRFIAALDHNLHGEEILWVNYDTGISLHRVHTTNRKEQRGQRLSSLTPLDNRISFGCINVPVTFYTKVISPTFTGTNGVVYVLPEVRSLSEVFGLYEVVKYAELPIESK